MSRWTIPFECRKVKVSNIYIGCVTNGRECMERVNERTGSVCLTSRMTWQADFSQSLLFFCTISNRLPPFILWNVRWEDDDLNHISNTRITLLESSKTSLRVMTPLWPPYRQRMSLSAFRSSCVWINTIKKGSSVCFYSLVVSNWLCGRSSERP